MAAAHSTIPLVFMRAHASPSSRRLSAKSSTAQHPGRGNIFRAFLGRLHEAREVHRPPSERGSKPSMRMVGLPRAPTPYGQRDRWAEENENDRSRAKESECIEDQVTD